MKLKKIAAVALAGAGLVGVAMTSPATADPNGAPTFRALSGVGSDTTDNVMQALSDVVLIGGVKQIGSYFASGSANITTKNPATLPACTIPRPNGSGAGRTALLNAINTASGCVDFARSSSGPATSGGLLSYVEFATDAVDIAVRADGNLPKDWTLADIQSAYRCELLPDVHPVLPQAGSGTRSYWLGKMGITETQISNGTYPCLTGAGTNASRAYAQEHTGNTLKVDEIEPYSVAQYNTQANGTISDLRGKSVLGRIDNTVPNAISTGFTSNFQRKVYNIIPTSKEGTAPWSTVFVGGSSLVCANSTTILNQGFRVDPTCGAVTQTP